MDRSPLETFMCSFIIRRSGSDTLCVDEGIKEKRQPLKDMGHAALGASRRRAWHSVPGDEVPWSVHRQG